MRGACAEYIGRRKSLLHLLRKENLTRFEQVVSALEIDYKPRQPFDFRLTVKANRKEEVKQEGFEKRRAKMEAYAKAVEAEREAFFAEKEATIAKLNEELKEIGLDTRSIFEEVVRERQEELMAPIRADEVAWFEREKALKETYLRVKAEKEEKAAKKRRK